MFESMLPVKSVIKVAVIGAGAAGLCCGRHLVAEPETFLFDIFEQQDEVGGTWRYCENVGKDEYGLPVHSSMYKNLKTNLPKEVMAFPDFPFPDCDGESFVHHSLVLQYLKDYAEYYCLYKYIKFHKLIENIRPLKCKTDCVEWAVSYSDVITKEKETKIYDAVMVCNGHYSVPYVPEIPGLKDFTGILMHSHDYRDAKPFKGLKVVILGAGASGIDIAIEVASEAKEVILSHNLEPKECPPSLNLRQERGIESIHKSLVNFVGGGKYECDALLLCTGYLYHYPFFDSTCNVQIGDQRISPLYLHTFFIENPTLAIWGIPKLIVPFPIYDQQVKVFLKFVKGSIKLPSEEEMRRAEAEDFARRLEAGMKPRHAHIMPQQLQWELDSNISALGQIPTLPDVVQNLFKHVHHIRKKDFVNYKKTKYTLINNKDFIQIE